MTVLYTPGHTDDSCCFVMPDRVFTGDTLVILGTGRTDFQYGDPVAACGREDGRHGRILSQPVRPATRRRTAGGAASTA
jgi:glyoxylase-like metal-dependent hydrolase (beta-lactamase superfamily II)